MNLCGNHPRHQRRLPDCLVEVLIPDFKGEAGPLETVLCARPDVLNHNTETVPRLYRAVRWAASTRARWSCSTARAAYAPDIPTKTGMMMGLGEER